MEKLHPGAKWLFRVHGFLYMVFLIIIFALSFFVSLLGSGLPSWSQAAIWIVVLLIAAEVYARLAYANWRYEFTQEGLKTEKGIIWKKYTTIPYSRVQNVDIHRGIVARIFGFSSINIQTAGAAYAGGRMGRSEGHLPAVDMKEAEHLRTSLIKHLSGKHQGL